jgi:hypothetical protein
MDTKKNKGKKTRARRQGQEDKGKKTREGNAL